MMWRVARAAIAVALASAVPAQADDINQWGVWGDGAQMREGGSSGWQPNFIGAGPGLGMMPGYYKPVPLAQGGPRPDIAPTEPEVVAFAGDYAPGSIVIDTKSRRLYYVLTDSTAYRYPIAVGKVGFAWTGVETVSKIVDWPDWFPPEEMRLRKPSLPLRMTGGLNNPLGAKAIYLGNSLYRIHGTNDAGSIGSASSSGCFRMHNGHVVHLAALVADRQNVTVHVIRSLPKGVVAMSDEVKKVKASGKI